MEVMLNYSNGVVEILGLYSRVKNRYIGVIYRQPHDRAGGYRSTEKKFYTALSKLVVSLANLSKPSPNIIICGDMLCGLMGCHLAFQHLKISYYLNA